MFENPTPIPHAQTARFGGQQARDADLTDSAIAGGESGAELRMFEWCELTARLNAARDLRHLLRRDADRSIGASAHDFADAAARYFRTRDEGQSNVNPVALEQFKCSPGIIQEQEGLMEEPTKFRKLLKKSDARED